MINKGTYLTPVDNSGIWAVGVFHIYGGFFRKFGKIGTFFKVSIKTVKINFIILKKSKVSSILILSKYHSIKNDKTYIKTHNNKCVLLKKRLQPYGKEIEGPIDKNVSRKKFIYSFSGII